MSQFVIILWFDVDFFLLYVMFVYVVLQEKSLFFIFKIVDLNCGEYLQVGWIGYVVICCVLLLEVDDFVLSEFLVIIEYLDECFVLLEWECIYLYDL